MLFALREMVSFTLIIVQKAENKEEIKTVIKKTAKEIKKEVKTDTAKKKNEK